MSLKARAGSIWARLVKQYRLVVYDHESLSQSRHILFKPLTGILLGLGVVSVAFLLAALLFGMMPGRLSGGVDDDLLEDYKSMQSKNMDLEQQVTELDSMLSVLRNAMGAGAEPQPVGDMFRSAMPEPANSNTSQANTPPEPAPVDPQPSHEEGSSPGLSAPPVTHKARGPVVYNLVPPIDGYVTKDFIPKDKPHFGIDLAADEDALVRSVADGVVIFAEYSSTTGHVVGIWHSQYNMVSFYKHNSRTYKTVGSSVFAGEAIAVIGNTGINSSGTHLHFELWYNDNPVDPAAYINFN